MIAAALALLAPVALADPTQHPHDYLATLKQERASAQPPDVRYHAEMKQLMALYGNPWARTATTTAGFSWADAGIGAGTTIGGLLILGTATALVVRRRNQTPALAPRTGEQLAL
jgi:hypothetical protein